MWTRWHDTSRLWQTLPVRRSLGGLILLVAGGLFALAISTLWLDRVAFSPSASTDATFSIIADEDIRRQIATLVAQVDAPSLGVSPVALSETIEALSDRRAMAAQMRRFVAEAHAVVIGDDDGPVQILAVEQVQIVRNEGVALQPAITLPVTEVGTVSIVDLVVSWTWKVAAVAALVATLVGFFIRPERGEFVFAFGLGCAATGVLLVLMGYVVPAFVLPALSADTWMGVFPRLAAYYRNLTLVGALAFLSVGALTTIATSGLRQRRQRSTPLATTRYREDQRWSAR